ncbi:MAG: hypothetical protein HKN25_00595 [Pyrinomonadaceae bacterium]|nr:hypothetical protein [Pyrinomonadaceae bacterium]
MKKITISLMLVFILGINAFASVYIKYSNKDSQTHKFKVKKNGSTTTVEFRASTTGAATIQGSGDTAVIVTKCGEVTIKTNSKIEIKNGCIKIL